MQHLRALSPAEVIVIDQNARRRDYAIELGAHHVIDGVDRSTVKQLQSLIGGSGAHAVLDFVGIDDSIATGIRCTRPLGSYALVGAGGGTLQGPWSQLPKGGEIFTYQGPTIANTREVVRLAEAGLIRVDTEQFPMSRIADAYAALDAGTLLGRAVVIPRM